MFSFIPFFHAWHIEIFNIGKDFLSFFFINACFRAYSQVLPCLLASSKTQTLCFHAAILLCRLGGSVSYDGFQDAGMFEVKKKIKRRIMYSSPKIASDSFSPFARRLIFRDASEVTCSKGITIGFPWLDAGQG